MKSAPRSPDPLAEDELVAGWNGSTDAPLVSICCTTFNQVDVVDDAIRGFLAQRTDFPFEVIVHDDASTDGTADVVRRWAATYPRVVRAVVQEENQYTRTGRTLTHVVPFVRGDLVAICEGDDYWTSPYKLQRQVDGLGRHPGVELCVHPAWKITYPTGRVSAMARAAKTEMVVTTDDLIARRYGRMPMASLLMTRPALDRYLDFREIHDVAVGDVFLAILASAESGALLLPKLMSVYRWRRPGSWTSTTAASSELRAAHAYAQLSALDKLEDHLEKDHTAAFRVVRGRFAWSLIHRHSLTRRERLGRIRRVRRYLGRRQLIESLLTLVKPSYRLPKGLR